MIVTVLGNYQSESCDVVVEDILKEIEADSEVCRFCGKELGLSGGGMVISDFSNLPIVVH